jgi:hypothetical protein
MRILAQFRSASRFDAAMDELRIAFAEHGVLPVGHPVERVAVVEQLVEDMSEADRHRFQRTVRYVGQDPIGGLVATISELPEQDLLVRLRHVTLRDLVPPGHRIIASIMQTHGPKGTDNFKLQACELRERGTHHGFLYAAWEGGETRFLRFLFSQRRAQFVTTFLLVGLFLEVFFSFVASTSEVGSLALRIGAPMMVSSLVLILERRAQWRDQREPQLRWSTSRRQPVGSDPFAIAPGENA